MDILLALLVLLAVADAILNSFLFFPAILVAGALTGRRAPIPVAAATARG